MRYFVCLPRTRIDFRLCPLLGSAPHTPSQFEREGVPVLYGFVRFHLLVQHLFQFVHHSEAGRQFDGLRPRKRVPKLFAVRSQSARSGGRQIVERGFVGHRAWSVLCGRAWCSWPSDHHQCRGVSRGETVIWFAYERGTREYETGYSPVAAQMPAFSHLATRVIAQSVGNTGKTTNC